jgi:catechol 2,3-dioxygenase-like lactoylglutathione lyase family enzyme
VSALRSADLARRFLHVNLNCASLEAAEAFYADGLGLSARMRTDSAVPTNGSILGLEGETYCATSFLYNARGGRAGCALEIIDYRTPALRRDTSADPLRRGIRSTLMTVPDLHEAVAVLRAAGATVGDPVDGLISESKAVLAVDPDGVVVELAQSTHAGDAAAGALFSGIRVAAGDLGATGEFLTAIGFLEAQPPTTMTVSGQQLAPGGSAERAECTVARYALAEDGHRFVMTVVAHPETAASDPVPWGGNHQGLYRCALRVDSVEKALDQVPNSVERMGDPVWCPLPGTKIDGLFIAFLRSPDGVVFEFVERPLKYFSR